MKKTKQNKKEEEEVKGKKKGKDRINNYKKEYREQS